MIWGDWLAAEAAARAEQGLTRRLTPRPLGDPTTDLAGDDYLGLARDPTVQMAAAHAALTWGTGAGASRLVTGTLELHADLERELASYLEQPTALVLATGYHANLAVMAALADRTCRVLSDAHVHASLVDGIRLSRAQVTVVPHNDVDAVRRGLAAAAAAGERTLVVVESVYSVLGDAAPLAELAHLCEEHDALLVVDEAHGLGVHGPGLVATNGLAGLPHVVVTATLSGSLGSQGGAVLGPAAVREHVVSHGRPFIFDTALAPPATAAALASLRLLRERADLPALVRQRAQELSAALAVPAPQGAVLPVPMRTPGTALAAQAAALEAGVRVGCLRPPSVPDSASRLRVTASAGIEDDDWRRAVEVLQQVVKEHG